MLTASFVARPGTWSVMLPETVSALKATAENMVVSVSADDRMWVDDRPVERAGLTEALEQSVTKEYLTIKGDRGARWGTVAEVWDAARAAGFSEIRVATERRKEDY